LSKDIEKDLSLTLRSFQEENDKLVRLNAEGPRDAALALAFRLNELARERLPQNQTMRLKVLLNLVATLLNRGTEKELRRLACEAITLAGVISRRFDADPASVTAAELADYQSNLARLEQVLLLFAERAEAAGDFTSAAHFWTGIVECRSLRSSDHAWLAADARLTASRLELLGRLDEAGRNELQQGTRASNLAVRLHDRGKTRLAQSLLVRAWSLMRRRVPRKHVFWRTLLVNTAANQFKLGNLRRADRYYAICEGILRRNGIACHPTYASTRRMHAEVVRTAGRFVEARRMLVEALRIVKSTLGRSNLDYMLCLNDTAVHYHWASEYRKAIGYYKRALAVDDRLSEPSSQRVSLLVNVAACYSRLQHYDAAEAAIQRALDLSRRIGPAHSGTVDCLFRLAVVNNERGRHAECQIHYRQAIEIQERLNGKDDPRLVDLLHGLGLSVQTTGNDREAQDTMLRALGILQKHYDETNLHFVHVLKCLGDQSCKLQDFHKAEEYYRRSLSIAQENYGVQHTYTAEIYEGFAHVLRNLNKLDEALDYLKKARAIFGAQLGKEHRRYALVLNHLGMCYSERQDFQAAAGFYTEALQIRRRVLGPDHDDYATSLNNLANLYQKMGQFDRAAELFNEAIAVYRRSLGEDHAHLALGLSNLGLLHAHRRDWAKAIDFLEQSVRIDDRNLRYVLLLASERQRLAVAAKAWTNVTAFISVIYRAGYLQKPEYSSSAYKAVLRRKGMAVEVFTAQNDAVLRGRHPQLEQDLAEYRALRLGIAQEMLGGTAGGHSLERQERLRSLRSRLEAMETVLARQVPEVDFQRQTEKADPQELARALPPKTALVEFVKSLILPLETEPALEGPEPLLQRYLAFVLVANLPDALRVIDLGEAAPIDQAIGRLRQAIAGNGEAATTAHHGTDVCTDSSAALLKLAISDFTRDLQPRTQPTDSSLILTIGTALRALVFDPLLTALGDRTRLIIAPDGELATLPFAVLPLGQERHVIDDFNISYLGTGRDMLRSHGGRAGHAGAPLVVADPNFDLGATGAEVRSTTFTPLNGTRAEGIEVARLLKTSPVLGSDAVEGHLKVMRSPRVLHIATHGFFLPTPDAPASDGDGALPGRSIDQLARVDNPFLRSGLALAGANTWLSGGILPAAAEDGLLTAEDVAGLDLVGTDLVVLSACSTGLGDVQAGEGVFGLRRAFAIAGARCLVLSLWRVPDQQTQELMLAFYRCLLDGEARPDALRTAQLVIKAKYRDPLSWGGFVCEGDFAAIDLCGNY
jgi:CHAT domain-containing protein/tetratricopeptide (TPR) repeat protein